VELRHSSYELVNIRFDVSGLMALWFCEHIFVREVGRLSDLR
jgi:hypothetical protein